jgi:hypothetical protein
MAAALDEGATTCVVVSQLPELVPAWASSAWALFCEEILEFFYALTSGMEGVLICFKHIYNFLCSMLVFTPFALCFITLRGVFMRFPELTY